MAPFEGSLFFVRAITTGRLRDNRDERGDGSTGYDARWVMETKKLDGWDEDWVSVAYLVFFFWKFWLRLWAFWRWFWRRLIEGIEGIEGLDNPVSGIPTLNVENLRIRQGRYFSGFPFCSIFSTFMVHRSLIKLRGYL